MYFSKKNRGIIILDILITFILILWFIGIIGLYQQKMYAFYKEALWKIEGTVSAYAYIEYYRYLKQPLVSGIYDAFAIKVHDVPSINVFNDNSFILKKIIVLPVQSDNLTSHYKIEFFCAQSLFKK